MKHKHMERLSACPICGHVGFYTWLRTKDFTVSKEEFDIVCCEQCGLKFTNPRPAQNQITQYYESKEYISHHDEKQGIVPFIYKWVREHITLKQKRRWVEKQLTHKGKLLDVGCGTGHFLFHMHKHGWDVSGVEPSLEASRKVRDSGIPVYERLEQLINNTKFDAITMWHVLEHIHHLNEDLQKLKDLLNTGGWLFIAVPNIESYDARFYGAFWAALDVPRHLYHFSPAHMKQLLQKHGLHLQEIKGMPLDAYYISLLSSEYRSGKKQWAEAIYRGTLSNLHALKNKNYSSLVYIVNKIN